MLDKRIARDLVKNLIGAPKYNEADDKTKDEDATVRRRKHFGLPRDNLSPTSRLVRW